MKKVFTLLISLFFFLPGFSQSCLPDGITFSTQAQIDSFQVNYPNCTEIEGDVNIQGSSIRNLYGLSVLTSIGGSLSIRYNDLLSNVTGLNNLTQIGSLLSIEYNDSLKNITAFFNLTDIGTFIYIQGNAALTSLNGLEGITTIRRLVIWNNDGLTSLTGLDNLTSISVYLSIYHNDSLINFSGLNQLDSIGGDLIITFNAGLTSMEGLERLTYVGSSLQIGYNDILNSLEGLDELTYIRLGLFIAHNPNLTNVSDLINLTTVKHAVWIEDNDVLGSLSGIDNLNPIVFDTLYICDNQMLTECEVQSVCEYLANSPYYTIINNNATGCNSIPEVIETCLADVGESQTGDQLRALDISPNPSTTAITIALPTTAPIDNATLSIYNVNAQQVISRSITEPITVLDISTLPSGVYFARITTERTAMVSNFIKQ